MGLGLCGGAWWTVRDVECCSELGLRMGGLMVGLSQVALGKSYLLPSLVLPLIVGILGHVHLLPLCFFRCDGKIKTKEGVKWKPHVPE